MRRVLHLKMVTQCAMLEDFGIFLVLADKVCLITGRRDTRVSYRPCSRSLLTTSRHLYHLLLKA